MQAAAQEAAERGYRVKIEPIEDPQPEVHDIAQRLAHRLTRPQSVDAPACLISGGEPTMKLVEPQLRGRGGRNQQLVLAALEYRLQWQNAPNRRRFSPSTANSRYLALGWNRR